VLASYLKKIVFALWKGKDKFGNIFLYDYKGEK
jgi:hypothetical protein